MMIRCIVEELEVRDGADAWKYAVKTVKTLTKKATMLDMVNDSRRKSQ